MKKIFTNERLVIVILIILMGVGVNYHLNKRSKDEKKYEMQVKLTEALNDSVTTYQTKEGNWISEKRTLQGDLGDLTEENVGLNANQKALLGTIHTDFFPRRILLRYLICWFTSDNSFRYLARYSLA